MFIDSGDARLYATSFGPTERPVIVGIGGWIGSWELWAEPFSILSSTWRTIAYDHRGSGASVAPTETILFENLVADLFTVLDTYGVTECTLAAESAGALTALAAALQDPQRIKQLVIVDGQYDDDIGDPAQDAFLRGLQAAYDATLDWFVERCVPEPDCAHIKRWGRQIIDRAAPENAIALRLTGIGRDFRDSLDRISQPTLVIHGEQDSLIPVQKARELAARLPDAELVILPGAGHVPTLTRPFEVADAIAAFLTRS